MNRDTSTTSVTRIQRQTKIWIKQALLELLDTYMFDEITVKQIVNAAEISRPTFYRNYSSKDEVLNEFFDDIISGYEKTVKNDPPNTFEGLLGVCFAYFGSKQAEFKVIIKSHLMDDFTSIFTKRFVKEIDDFPAPWRPWDNDLQVSVGIQFALGGIVNVLIGWIANDCLIDSKILIKEILNTIDNLAK